jgi:AmiR/NasT family two-component response regulator
MTESLRIAVADDELDMRDFFERMLPRCGHTVVSVAESGEQLIEHCRQQQPDLVITDIKMPGVDGLEAASRINRERPTPVILVSAYHDPALIERAEADHVLAYLVKPIVFAALQPAIAVAMRRFAEVQALQKECSDLRQTLADRKLIEQAKGILMRVAGVDEKEAFRRLQELASEQNKKLAEAAKALIAVEKAIAPPRGN